MLIWWVRADADSGNQMKYDKGKMGLSMEFWGWSDLRESNPHQKLGKLLFYH